VDTYLAVASKRDERRYAARAIPEDLLQRVLDAGRLAGSAGNRQPWRFVVVESRELLDRLAGRVYEPDNVRGAALAIALVPAAGRPAGFDLGRAAQNIMLTAWNEGVASCPNGLPDAAAAADLLDLAEGEVPATILSLGYPARGRDPRDRAAEEWSAAARRRPLAELVTRL
jgi:nitroreductase